MLLPQLDLQSFPILEINPNPQISNFASKFSCFRSTSSSQIVQKKFYFQCAKLTPKASHFLSGFSILNQAHPPKTIIYARKKKRRSGSSRLGKLILRSMSIIATNLKILPQPLDLVIEEFGGGDGGGFGFWKGFGGGGFGGWRKEGKRNFGLLMLVGFCLVLGRELKDEVFWWVLGSGLFGFFWIKSLKRGAKNWVLGFCCLAALVSLLWRSKKEIKWLQELRVCSSLTKELMRRGDGNRRTNGRRAF